MKFLLHNLNKLVSDSSFKIVVLDNKIDLINYKNILVLEDNLVLIESDNKLVKIKGENLVIKKLECNELLIEGIIRTINLGD